MIFVVVTGRTGARNPYSTSFPNHRMRAKYTANAETRFTAADGGNEFQNTL